MCRGTRNVASVPGERVLLRAEAKRADMTRTYGGEMTTVGSCHFDGIESFCNRNHGCINESQLEVRVFRDQRLSSANVLCLEWLNNELAAGYRA